METEKNNSTLGLDFSLSEICGNNSESFDLNQVKLIRPNYCILSSPTNRAIPEAIITGLVEIACQPIIRFNLPLGSLSDVYEIGSIINAYANWGVKRIILFDQPNMISNWGTEVWLQNDLVNRFIDRFLIVNQYLTDSGIIPVMPPLNPSGNFPDLLFLRKSLENFAQRIPSIFDKLELSAFAWTFNHEITWGKGGGECNLQIEGEDNANQSETHKGFRIFDWYNEISQAVLQKTLPTHLLQVGLVSNEDYLPRWESNNFFFKISSTFNETITSDSNNVFQLPPNIASFNIILPQADVNQTNELIKIFSSKTIDQTVDFNYSHNAQTSEGDRKKKQIQKYVLLPSYEWGVSDWHLDSIRTFIKNHRPTVGFSIEEAKLSEQVIVINDQAYYSPEQIDEIRSCNCQVEEINEIGTSVATILAAR